MYGLMKVARENKIILLLDAFVLLLRIKSKTEIIARVHTPTVILLDLHGYFYVVV